MPCVLLLIYFYFSCGAVAALCRIRSTGSSMDLRVLLRYRRSSTLDPNQSPANQGPGVVVQDPELHLRRRRNGKAALRSWANDIYLPVSTCRSSAGTINVASPRDRARHLDITDRVRRPVTPQQTLLIDQSTLVERSGDPWPEQEHKAVTVLQYGDRLMEMLSR